MSLRHLLFYLFCIYSFSIQAQFFENCKVFEDEAVQYKARINNKSHPATYKYDVIFYHLKLQLDPRVNYIKGSVVVKFKSLESMQDIYFDLSDSLTVDSILFKGEQLTLHHENNALEVILNDSILQDSLAEVEIYYQGIPRSDMRSFTQSSYAEDSIIWTLSQPYGAQDWWPCKNSLQDKADSVTIDVQVPKGYKVASLGLIRKIDSTDNHINYQWHTDYLTATYLVAVAVAKYKFYEEKIKVNEDSLLMHHFLYADQSLISSNNAIEGFVNFFDSLFDSYPFIKEKYGHASFTAPGGMEHQTMSFMGSYGGELVAHELAHQWFGNKVTCGSWQDLWLNEGFATYLTALTYEFDIVHDKSYWPLVKELLHGASFNYPHSSVFKEDTTDVTQLFDANVYQKGASFLHMLRWQIGDSAFFAGVKNYIKDSTLINSSAKTDDLKEHLEVSSRQNLDEFFKDWFYGKGFPTYTTTWSQEAGNLKLKIKQSSSDPSVYFFNIPIPYQIYSGNLDTTIIVDPQFSGQTFDLNIGKIIDSIAFDKEDWILAKHDLISGIYGSNEIYNESIYVYPNPSSGIFRIEGLDGKEAQINLYSAEGKHYPVSFLNQQINISDLPQGVYFLIIELKNNFIVKKLFHY